MRKSSHSRFVRFIGDKMVGPDHRNEIAAEKELLKHLSREGRECNILQRGAMKYLCLDGHIVSPGVHSLFLYNGRVYGRLGADCFPITPRA